MAEPTYAEPTYVECGLAVVHPWLCDAMGHLTTRHYLAMFDDASYHLFAAIGYDATAGHAERWGWADVRHEIEYKAELAAGSLVRIEGRITAIGTSSISSEMRMIARDDGRICATLVGKTVCFDLAARRSRPVPADIAARSAELFGLPIRVSPERS